MQLDARPSVQTKGSALDQAYKLKGRRNIMTTIKFNACQDNMGDVTGEQYENYKAAVKAAISAEYPQANVIVGDSNFANASEINVNSEEDISRDDIKTIANRVFESDKWW